MSSTREESSWTTIESDPGIFTLLIESLGVKGVQVEELYSLDNDQLVNLQPIYGFIFLFKWIKSDGINGDQSELDYTNDKVFFAQQEITNACATQAILHVLLNNKSTIELGKIVQDFFDFTIELPPDMRGLALSNSLEIRQIHNNFGNLEDQLAYGDEDDDEDNKKDKKSDPFHFVAFIQNEGKIYELDGLKDAPISYGSCDDSWEERVLEILRKRIDSVSSASSEIRFNLMAVIGDRRKSLTNQITQIEAEITENPDASTGLHARLFDFQSQLEGEESKRKGYKREVEERKKMFTEMQGKRIKVENQVEGGTNLSPQVQNLLEQLKAKGLYKF